MSLTPREQADVVAALAFGVDAVEPSAALKANIMAKIAQTPQLPAVEAETDQSVANLIGVGVPASGAPEGSAETRARARWFSRPIGILTAAAAALLLFAGGTVVGLQVSGTDAPNLQAESLAGLTAAPDVQRASVTVDGGGEATLIWSLDQRKSAILVNNLPALPGDKTYQLWYIGEQGPIPAGTFDSNTAATSWRVLDGQMSAGDTVGVTVEPSGGSEKPTTDPIAVITSS